MTRVHAGAGRSIKSAAVNNMAIQPKCDKCKEELKDFGAILLSPPNKKNEVKKFHICKGCYKEMAKNVSSK